MVGVADPGLAPRGYFLSPLRGWGCGEMVMKRVMVEEASPLGRELRGGVGGAVATEACPPSPGTVDGEVWRVAASVSMAPGDQGSGVGARFVCAGCQQDVVLQLFGETETHGTSSMGFWNATEPCAWGGLGGGFEG